MKKYDRPKAKLFTAEFINCLMMLLAFGVGIATIVTYQDRLPLWMILAIGFWYPVGVLVIQAYKMFNRGGGDL